MYRRIVARIVALLLIKWRRVREEMAGRLYGGGVVQFFLYVVTLHVFLYPLHRGLKFKILA